MTREEFENLEPGNLVKQISGAFGECVFVVTANFGYRITAVATAELINEAEWEKVL